jgi:histidine ammonia-lyase
VLSNVQSILAIELLTGAQAVEWRAVFQYDPNRPAPKLLELEHAEAQAKQFEEAVSERAANIATQLGQGTRELYLQIRAAAKPVFYDRPLDDDIRAARRIIL